MFHIIATFMHSCVAIIIRAHLPESCMHSSLAPSVLYYSVHFNSNICFNIYTDGSCSRIIEVLTCISASYSIHPFLECMNYYILIIFGLVQRKLVPSDCYKLIIHKISGAQLPADNL